MSKFGLTRELEFLVCVSSCTLPYHWLKRCSVFNHFGSIRHVCQSLGGLGWLTLRFSRSGNIG